MPESGEVRAATAGLAAGDVHVWVASLDVAPRELHAFRRTLGAGEEDEAAQLASPTGRRRFIARRGLRRAVLARYVGCDPESLRFQLGDAGKPELAGGHDLRFNCSHSGGLALYAVARGRRLGVDVEWLRPVRGALAIARSLFSPIEAASLDTVPAGEVDEAFLRCWTRKEAFLKATGDGLGGGLDRFTVSLPVARDPAHLEAVADGSTRRWSLRGLAPAPGYVGAVVAEGSAWRVQCRPW